MRMFPVRTISLSIARDWREVYDFASRPENLPAWASGLGRSFHRDGDDWIAETPQGRVTVRFMPRNEHGVLDHHVMTGDGSSVYVPLRVVANGEGSEVVFTLFRLPEMTDRQFEVDASAVLHDLESLRDLLESAVHGGPNGS